MTVDLRPEPVEVVKCCGCIVYGDVCPCCGEWVVPAPD